MSDCNGNCDSCSSKSGCGIAKLEQPNDSRVRKVIGVVSGKGGVGKSMTCAALATLASRRGFNVGVIDGDITGASQPRIFGLTGNLSGDGKRIFPAVTIGGIKLVSINLMIDKEDTPVVWRGSMVSNCLKQFWSDVLWEDIDYMFVDMPPGTGDVPLTVFQSYPLNGIIIVTTPQDLVSMIVKKAVNMAKMMNVKILGLIENMSYIDCECGKRIYPFGEGKVEEIATATNIKVLAKQPICPQLAAACDRGVIEEQDLSYYDSAIDEIIKQLD